MNKDNPKFELVVQIRDNKGNLTGKTRSFTTDNPNELEQLWIKNNTQSNRDKYETRRNRNKRPSAADKSPDGQVAQGQQS